MQHLGIYTYSSVCSADVRTCCAVSCTVFGTEESRGAERSTPLASGSVAQRAAGGTGASAALRPLPWAAHAPQCLCYEQAGAHKLAQLCCVPWTHAEAVQGAGQAPCQPHRPAVLQRARRCSTYLPCHKLRLSVREVEGICLHAALRAYTTAIRAAESHSQARLPVQSLRRASNNVAARQVRVFLCDLSYLAEHVPTCKPALPS